jgi:hypothetical protein
VLLQEPPEPVPDEEDDGSEFSVALSKVSVASKLLFFVT